MLRKKWLCTQLPGWTFCFTPGYTRNSLIMSVLQAFDVCLRVDHSSNANTVVLLFHVEMQNTCIIYRIFCLLFFKNPFFSPPPSRIRGFVEVAFPSAWLHVPRKFMTGANLEEDLLRNRCRGHQRGQHWGRGGFSRFHGFGETCWTTMGLGEFCECKVYE